MEEEGQEFDQSEIRRKIDSVLPDGWTIKSITRNCVKLTCPAKDYFSGDYAAVSKKMRGIEEAIDAKFDGGGMRCGAKICTDSVYDLWFYLTKPEA